MFIACQRDSGDDEDMDKASEDEEGQLEEQIERLQEKVESAQSEQKNLFLVIFQVPSASRESDRGVRGFRCRKCVSLSRLRESQRFVLPNKQHFRKVVF